MYRQRLGEHSAYGAGKKLRIGFCILLSCLFITGGTFLNMRAAQAAWNLKIEGEGKLYSDYAKESEVFIGLADPNLTVPLPPPGKFSFSVFMQLWETNAQEYLYKEFKPSTGDVQIWLLNVLVDPNVIADYPASGYPSLRWNSGDVGPGVLELRKGQTGDLWDRDPRVQNMSATSTYQTRADDGTTQGDFFSMWYTIVYYPAGPDSACTTPPSSWTFSPAGWDSTMVIYGTVSEGSSVATEGDWIGAFGPGGDADCRGIGIVGADGSYCLTIGGTAGETETITLKVYKCSDSTPYDVQQTVTFAAGAVATQELSFGLCIRTQTIELAKDWNWVSFNVLPDDISMAGFFGDNLDLIEQVKTYDDQRTKFPQGWSGNAEIMSNISNGAMFVIKTKEGFTLSVTGTCVEPDLPFTLVKDWTWIGYLPNSCLPAEEVIEDISSDLLQVKSQTTGYTKFPQGWSGDLDMCPGLGYKIYMNAERTFVYPNPW